MNFSDAVRHFKELKKICSLNLDDHQCGSSVEWSLFEKSVKEAAEFANY